jgi:hypothetical protein
VNRDEIAAKKKCQGCCQGSLEAGPQFTHEAVGKYACQEEMKNYGPVEGQVERQEKVGDTQWVEYPRLDGGKKRYATFYEWIPERKMTLTDSFNPDRAKWIKKRGKVSFHQQDLAGENVVKVEQSEDEKAQNHKSFLQCWVSDRH